MVETERYDAIVVGAGQGGKPLAIDLAGSGRRTALVERKYVGGTLASRAHKGDPQGVAPFTPVPPDVQREALTFVADRAFSPQAFNVPPALLEKVGRDQFTDWGTNLFAYGQQEYPFVSRVEMIQSGVLNGLLAPALLTLYEGWHGRFGPIDAGGEALRRLFELDPVAGRSLILEEIASGAHGIASDVLSVLPDRTLPDLDAALTARLSTRPPPGVVHSCRGSHDAARSRVQTCE